MLDVVKGFCDVVLWVLVMVVVLVLVFWCCLEMG